jgi:tRNA(fMet)-specific endonuclease VapC
VEVFVFDQRAADGFAAVATALARRGAPIGALDTLMAAHALSLGLTFVTNNTRRFSRVGGLKTENWV